MLSIFFTSQLFYQNPSGISISWDVSTGCQTYSQEIRDGKDPIFLEDIIEGQCITVCENSQVTYTLTGNFATNPNTTWNVIGGIINSQSNSQCTITWGSNGQGQLTFSTTSTTGLITKTICFDKVIIPSVLFNIEPTELGKPLVGCSNQVLYFNNLSTTNGGSGLYSYSWSFGDGTFSSAFEPTHSYAADGIYQIKLTVTNSCGCSNTFKKDIKIGKIGFDIICPSVVCDGQTAQYSLPFDGIQICQNNFNWSVIGGTFTNPNDGVLNVTWDHVDNSGFGYVTFNPSNCNLICSEPTTIRIPVIQSVGTITGNSTMCLGIQERYVLPQWPATTFTWEIEGNDVNPLAEVIETNQHNEVIINPFVSGILKLKATYYNTLLHCGGTATFSINVTNVLQISGSEAVCQNASTTYNIETGENTSWTLKNSVGTTIASQLSGSSFTYNFPTVGTYTLSVSGSVSCPSNTKTIVVVPVAVAPVVVNPKTIICPNAPYTYTIAGTNANAQYVWQVTGGTFVGATTGNSVTIIYDNSATHVLTVYNQTTVPIICNSPSTTINITRQLINASISSLNGTVCANSYKDYSAIITSSSPEASYNDGDTYTWSLSNPTLGSITAGQGTKNITVLWNNLLANTGNTPVDLILVINKCTITSPQIIKSILVRPVPKIIVNSTLTSVCSGISTGLTFTAAAVAGYSLDTGSVVTWTVNGVTNPTTSTTLSGIVFNNVSGAPNNQYVTATIVNPNGCAGTTNTATFVITVNPEPTATASNITAGGINTFCQPTQINATLKAATITGATIQWYKTTPPGTTYNLIVGQTGVNISTANFGFGSYRFIATKTGCTSTSNAIEIKQMCGEPLVCTISPTQTVTNVSTKGCTTTPPVNTGCATCGSINLIATATGNPILKKWVVNGPVNFSSTGSLTATVPNPVVGVYNSYFSAVYPCTDGQNGVIQAYKEIVIAYLPDFDFKPLCSNNSTFTLSVADKTSVLGGVTSKILRYTYKKDTDANWQPFSTFAGGNGQFTTNLTAGNYQVKLIVTGTYGGVAQQACEKVYSFTLAGVPSSTITVGSIPCHDTAVQFNISTLPLSGDSYIWDFNDGSTNTLKDPKHVFLTSGSKTVNLRIINKYGCYRDLTPVNIIIPPKCFNGAVISNPNPASVCAGNGITLSYLPTAGECGVVNYKWMDGNVQIATTPTVNVTTEGFYWVKVSKAGDICAYDTPNRITPTFKPLPTLEFPVIQSVCANSAISAIIITNATSINNTTSISWKINNTVQPQFANLTAINIPAGFAAGTYAFEVTVTSSGGCSKTASQTLVVAITPASPIITQTLVSCNPYTVKLTATGTGGNYNWSNGANTFETTVTEGGPYSLTVSSGGCKVVTQVDVPRSPENLLWVFPTGCYTTCQDNVGTLIGPKQPVKSWDWLLDGTSIGTGLNAIVTPLALTQSGVYNLNVSTQFCDLTSGDLNYTVTPCERCNIDVQVNSIVPTATTFCSYVINLNIFNSSGGTLSITFTNPANTVIVSPSSFTLNAGGNTIQILVTPIGNLNSFLNLLINGFNVKDNTRCIFPLTVTLPTCAGSSSKLINNTKYISLLVAPNPTKNGTSISYSSNTKAPIIEVYSILGNRIASYESKGTIGIWDLETTNMSNGIYIVVMKVDGLIVSQQKLIKN